MKLILAILFGSSLGALAQTKDLMLTWTWADTNTLGWWVYYANTNPAPPFPTGWSRVAVSTNSWAFTNNFATNLFSIRIIATNSLCDSDPSDLVMVIKPNKPGNPKVIVIP